MKNKTIKKELIETEFVKLLETIKPNKKHLILLKETVLDLWQEKQNILESDAIKFKKKVDVLEAKRQRIFEMREDGSYSKEDFMERKAEVDNELAITRISLNESNIDKLDVEATITYAINFVEHLDRQWVDLKNELRPRFQKLIFPEGILYFKGKGFQTTKLSLMLATKKTARYEQSPLVTPRGIEPRFPG